MSLRQTFWLAGLGLARNPRRTTVTALALGNAVAGGLIFFGFTRHTYWGLSESFARAGNGHVQIAEAGWFDSPNPEAHRTPVARLQEVEAAILDEPDLGAMVSATTLRRHVTGMLVDGERSGVFMGTGTDPEVGPILAPLATPTQGVGLHQTDEPAAVLLGEPLAGRLEVQPGDTVTAMVTTDQGLTNALDLEVVGLVRTGAVELDRVFASMSTGAALQLTDGETADVLIVGLHDTEDTAAALARIDAVLSEVGVEGERLEARPWSDLASYYIAVKALYDRIFGIFELLMVLVTALSMSHAIAAVVAERRTEIALLRVVGLRKTQVAGIFVAEGAILGALGCLVGGLVAQGVSWAVEAAGGIPMPPPPGFTVGYNALIFIDALGYAIVVPATIFAAMVASAVPAWRASRGALSRALTGAAVLLAVGLQSHDARAAAVAVDTQPQALFQAAIPRSVEAP